MLPPLPFRNLVVLRKLVGMARSRGRTNDVPQTPGSITVHANDPFVISSGFLKPNLFSLSL